MTRLFIIFVLSLFATVSMAGPTPAPADAEVDIIVPLDGSEVTSPVTVRFGLWGMDVAPAGTIKDNAGHHHLIIDAELPDMDQPIPSNNNYIHFGGGQTETTLELAPGEHTLQLLVGDFMHVPHKRPVMSEKITITVK